MPVEICYGFFYYNIFFQIFTSVLQKMFYAVAKGHQVGVYNSWAECQSQINGFSGPKFRKFPTKVV